jgi:predicted Zn finger-like uncharacterized protein
MDVTCERCETAYEFDDALVSERGTTVKCTNCGHQFKVRRATTSGPERWLVRTIDGRELEFRALRELQGAIAQAHISREDVLSRGSSRPRRLGSIAELEPFFANAGSQTLGWGTASGVSSSRMRTSSAQGLSGVNMPAASPRRDTAPAGTPSNAHREGHAQDDTTQRSAGASSRRSRSGSLPDAQTGSTTAPLPGVVISPDGAPAPPSGRRRADSIGQEGKRSGRDRSRSAANEEAAPPAARLPPVEVMPNQRRSVPSSANLSREEVDASSAEGRAASASSSSIPRPAESGPVTSPVPVPPSVSRGAEGHDEPLSDRPRRAGAARWIGGVVLAGMLALAFATVGRKYLVPNPPPPVSATPHVTDERISVLLQAGEKSLLDGDLESAKEYFDKASILGDRDPGVAADLARLAMVRADLAWLRVRLLAESDPDLAAAKRELEQATQRARRAADRVAELAPNEPAAIRAQIDAARLEGNLHGARDLAPKISSASAQPDNALALAEIDLAEAQPDWPTVIGRLRSALSSDQGLGRARSMLAYALSRSGDGTGARAEIDRLASLPRPHPLVAPLRAFVAREAAASVVTPEASASASASASAGKPVAGKGPTAPGRPDTAGPTGGRPDGRVPDDYVAPNSGVDTSDLPGSKPHPGGDAPKPPPPPPGVDTSDLPGFK